MHVKREVSVARNRWILTCDIDFSANPKEILNWSKKISLDQITNAILAQEILMVLRLSIGFTDDYWEKFFKI